MKHFFPLALLGLLAASAAQAQAPAAKVESPYRASATKVSDLVHTKLDVRFDYARRYLYGKEWVTLKPHAYPTDSLRLDAKGMDIKAVALMSGDQMQPLKYAYTDAANLCINLGKMVKPGEAYIIYIEYTAKPDELKVKGSAAITDAKGLYFINPDSAVAGKPVQIWTQGETEGSSAWFPTIDRPNQKTTDEISMTVPSKYVTLSNGYLASSKPAGPGLRTDTWKMELPHAPYLFMMAVGDFKIYKDTWRGKEVSYYLEPKYAPFAKQIFGNTPDMLEFFSNRLGVEYPWNKYAQIVCRDYVSGAMENTTATLHGEQVQLTDRELLDREYSGESVIAHELFHQWFGDNVTCASWSDIWLNEGFASYGEYLSLQALATPADARSWMDATHQRALTSTGTVYVADTTNVNRIFSTSLSYKKGAAVIHMLRYLLNDDTKFFRALRTYQSTFRGSTAHTADLQRIFEVEAGRPLGYFFQQWFRGQGYPTFTGRWNQGGNNFVLRVNETASQPGTTPFFDTDVDYRLTFSNGTTRTVRLHQSQASETFRFAVNGTITGIAVDPDQWVLDVPTAAPVRDNTLLAARTAAGLAPLTLYPNPCRDQLQLAALPAARLIAEALDATGRVVLRQVVTVAQPQLDTHALAPGLYHLRLLGPGNELLGQGRFVRE